MMTEAEFAALRAQLDADDLSAPLASRFLARSKLTEEVNRVGAPPAVLSEARLDCMLFAPFSGHNALPPFDLFHDEIRAEVGLNHANRRLAESPSPVTRAHAGWLLWVSEERRFRRFGGQIATAFVDWFEMLVARVERSVAEDDGFEAIEILPQAEKVVTLTGQRGLRARLVASALRFSQVATTPPLLRWVMEVGEYLASAPREMLAGRMSEVERLSDQRQRNPSPRTSVPRCSSGRS